MMIFRRISFMEDGGHAMGNKEVLVVVELSYELCACG
jgi:hypothetical protein